MQADPKLTLRECDTAFKEWAVVCEALKTGRQSLILRKGGIHEETGQFQLEHRQFWLFPTRFHQSTDELNPQGAELLPQVLQATPAADSVALSLLVKVEQAIQLTTECQLPRLAQQQVLNADTLDRRFHYKRPGLTVLLVRVYARETPIVIPDSPHFAGCKSWVDLPHPLSTTDLASVLDEAEHLHQMKTLRDILYPPQVV